MSDSLFDQLDATLEAFELAWQAGSSPDIDAFLATATEAPADLCAELVRLDLEYRLRRGENPRIEHYFARYPILQAHETTMRALVVHEYVVRQAVAPPVRPSEFGQRFPTLGLALQAELEALTSGPPEIPGFTIHDELGRGGMGIVYRATDVTLQRAVAVKVIQPVHAAHQQAVQRFRDEAQIMGQLQHPGIPPIYALGERHNGQRYLAMKLIEGSTLASLFAARTVPADDHNHLLHVFEQLCLTVAYAHQHRVVHRDLKPANVMVGAFGEVQVMDWGLAKAIGSLTPEAALPTVGTTTTRSGTVLGTPAYMAPEQARGEADRVAPTADVFALGAILCELLTGQPPYASLGNTVEAARAADLTDAQARLDTCGADAELVTLTRQCLAANPTERPTDAGRVAAAMAAWRVCWEQRLRTVEQEQAVLQATLLAETKRLRLRRRTAWLVILVLGIGIIGTSLGFWRSNRQRQRAESAESARAEQLALTHVRNGQLLLQQRQWADAWESFQLGRAAGYPNTAALLFDELNALHALNRTAVMIAKIDELALRADLSAHEQGRVALWRADMVLSAHGPSDRVQEWVRLALQHGLPGDEQAYAEALQATTTDAAIQALQRALNQNRFHRRAQLQLITLQLLRGHLHDAQRELAFARVLYPSDTQVPALQAIGHALQGRVAEAQQALAAVQTAWVHPQHVAIVQTLVACCEFHPHTELLLVPEHPAFAARSAELVNRLTNLAVALGAHLRTDQAPFPLVIPPVLRWSYGRLAAALPFSFEEALCTLANQPPEQQQRWMRHFAPLLRKALAPKNSPMLAHATAAHPEGCLLALQAMLLEEEGRKKEALEGYTQASRAASVLPVQRFAQLGMIEMGYQWANIHSDSSRPEEIPRVLSAIKTLADQLNTDAIPSILSVYFEGMASKAWQCGATTLTHEIIDTWLRHVPNNPRAYRLRAVNYWTDAKYVAAYVAATHARNLKPTDADIQTSLERVFASTRRRNRTQALTFELINSRIFLNFAQMTRLHYFPDDLPE